MTEDLDIHSSLVVSGMYFVMRSITLQSWASLTKCSPWFDPRNFFTLQLMVLSYSCTVHCTTLMLLWAFYSFLGVAPRAKLNQQRQRRFAAARDRQEGSFDTTTITPGTKFMATFSRHVRAYVASKISNDVLWKDVQVIFSGIEVSCNTLKLTFDLRYQERESIKSLNTLDTKNVSLSGIPTQYIASMGRMRILYFLHLQRMNLISCC